VAIKNFPMGKTGQPNSARLRVSTDGSGNLFLGWRGSLGVIDHIIDRRGELLHARARDDDSVAATVRFLGDAEEFAAIILAEFHVEVLAFDLQLPGLYEVIHFGKNGGVYDG
jgi:hypothetical protein